MGAARNCAQYRGQRAVNARNYAFIEAVRTYARQTAELLTA